MSIWDKIINIGIDEHELGREVVKIRLLNQLIVAAIFTSSLTLIPCIVFFDGYPIIFTTLIDISLESLALYFQFKRKYKNSRVMTTYIFPTVIAAHVIFLGGNFGETNVFTVMAFSAFILQEGNRKKQIINVLYICLLFIGSKLYAIQTYSGDFSVNPYDELLTFPMTIIIMGLIILVYQKELKEYEREKIKLIDSLEKKNKKLIHINDELEEFTYIASHDLKTPLRTVSSYLDLIGIHIKREDWESVDLDIAFAKRGALQMYDLIDDIMVYKKISHGDKKRENLDLNKLLADVEHGMTQFLQKTNGQIVNKGLPALHGNKHSFKVLFQNIIENGLKYNQSETPRIIISCDIQERQIILDFEDNGIGIAPKYQQQVFQFFKRLHSKDEYEGTGIGLGICKKIAQSYDGHISVSSEENMGATFQVVLPKSLMVE